MRWFKADKPYADKRIEIGAKKIKKRFCLFPTKFRGNGGTHYIWLASIYIVYERREGYQSWSSWDACICEPDYWQQIGVADSYDNALDQVWIGN